MISKILMNKGTINYIYNVKKSKKMLGFLGIMHFLAGPLLGLNILGIILFGERHSYEYGDGVKEYISNTYDLGAFATIAIIATAIASLAGIVCALNSFNYQYKKMNTDMVYALPMSTRQRFFSDYFSGLTVYIAPFLANSVITLILAVISDLVVKSDKNLDFSLGQIAGKEQTLTSFFLLIMIFGIILMLMLYTFSVLAVSFSGTNVAVGNIIALNIVIPSIILVAGLVFLNDVFGVVYTDVPFEQALNITSPFGGLAYFFSYLVDFEAKNYFLEWLLPSFIVTLLVLALAYFLTKKRKAEQVSTPYIFPIFYYIIISMIIFITTSFIYMGMGIELVPMLLVSGIIVFVISICVNKGFKNILKTGLCYVIATILTFGLINMGEATDGFGIAYIVPNADNVEEVRVCMYYNEDSEIRGDNVKLEGKVAIEAVTEAHEMIIDEYKKGFEDDYFVGSIEIKYKMKNGDKIYRNYYINYEKVKEGIEKIKETDEYKVEIGKYLNKKTT